MHKIMRLFPSRWLAPLSLVALLAAGCTQPRSAQEIADAGGLQNANFKAAQAKNKPAITASSSQVVGFVSWASRVENMGAVHLTVPPLPADTILVARANSLAPIAIMRTTNTVRGHTQGVWLINGLPVAGDQVIQPGPEYAPLIQANLGQGTNRAAKESFQAAGTADSMIVPGQ
jgi:hypothetical protein